MARGSALFRNGVVFQCLPVLELWVQMLDDECVFSLLAGGRHIDANWPCLDCSDLIEDDCCEIAILHLYLSEVNVDIGVSEEEQAVLTGIDKLGKQLQIDNLLEMIIEPDRRIQRQKRSQEVERAQRQLYKWFQDNIVRHTIVVDHDKADDIKWDSKNNIFADVLVCSVEHNELASRSRAGLCFHM